MRPRQWSPKEIADAGEKIYREKFKATFETKFHGKFVAIEVNEGDAMTGDSPDEVLEKAKAAHPEGIFHLIRVGFRNAFELSFAYRNAGPDWLFR